MKKTLIFLTIILLTASAFADITLHSRHRTHSGTYNFDSRFVLYEQLANVSVESGIIAQDFETAYDAMDAEGADEFEVPEGEIWTINEVVVLGSYSTAGPCELANVRFYEDAPGMPGTLLYEYLDVPANPDVDGNLDCFIPDTPFTEGTYWVSVQGRLDAGTCGLWFWIKQAAPTIGYEFHWQNPLDGFATGYTTWTTGSITHAGYIDYNLSFCLYGTVAGATPAAPTDVVVTPDAGGAVSVDIDWICPTLQVNGNPLTELLEMRVYRGVDIIYTDTSPVIGGPGNYTDAAVPAPGLYSFKVVGYNSSGEGIPIVETVYVGEDVPNVVENLLLERTSTSVLSGTLTWVNPLTGLNGGAFSEPILGYHIVRSDGATFELTGIATEYIDNTIPVADYYFYTVQAYNSIGDGGIETSNTVLIADAGLLIMEDFGDGVIPAGWSIIGQGAANWSIEGSNNASGTAPEAKFGWLPPFIGVSRFTTLPVDTSSMTGLTLEFKHLLLHYGGPYTISITTTSDGVTWNTTPFSIVNPPNNIGPETQLITIANPDVGSPTFQLAFTFDGDSFNIDYWYIDDVILIDNGNGDSGWIEGIVTLDGGTGNVEDAEVTAGSLTVNPDANGIYSIEIAAGTYDVTASLEGYDTDTVNGIVVEEDIITPDVNLTLVETVGTENIIITVTELIGNYPNPFNPETTISFSVTQNSDFVTLEIFNLKGQKVKTLINEKLPAGNHQVVWDGMDDNSKAVSSGIYFYKMNTNEYTSIKKMILLK